MSKSHLCSICKTAPGEVRSDLPALKCHVCSKCLEPVHGCNQLRVGRPSHLPPFSVEFEIASPSRSDRERAFVLLLHGYLRTYDSTVDDEYKSPIYQSLDIFRVHLPTLDMLKDLVNTSCGTHLHVGTPPELKRLLAEERTVVFGPLVQHWQEHLDQTEAFWGRLPCYYARENLYGTFSCIHISGRYDTVEFRLPRFRDADQYIAVVRFCRRLIYSLQTILPEGRRSVANIPKHLGQDVVTFYEESVKRHRIWMQNAMQRQLKRHGMEQLPLFP